MLHGRTHAQQNTPDSDCACLACPHYLGVHVYRLFKGMPAAREHSIMSGEASVEHQRPTLSTALGQLQSMDDSI